MPKTLRIPLNVCISNRQTHKQIFWMSSSIWKQIFTAAITPMSSIGILVKLHFDLISMEKKLELWRKFLFGELYSLKCIFSCFKHPFPVNGYQNAAVSTLIVLNHHLKQMWFKKKILEKWTSIGWNNVTRRNRLFSVHLILVLPTCICNMLNLGKLFLINPSQGR